MQQYYSKTCLMPPYFPEKKKKKHIELKKKKKKMHLAFIKPLHSFRSNLKLSFAFHKHDETHRVPRRHKCGPRRWPAAAAARSSLTCTRSPLRPPPPGSSR